MPIDVTSPQDLAISLDEFVDAVGPLSSKLRDEDVLGSLAPKFIQLANNRTFLGDILLSYLRTIAGDDGEAKGILFAPYTSHVVLLVLDKTRQFMIRAVIWPSANDYVYKINSDKEFSYNYPHDHNVSFLTVGYFGPGYVSDYYEVDPDEILGVPGESVKLRYINRAQLSEGTSLVYRAHRDIHVQYAPESLSISLNLMGSGLNSSITDQYVFDKDKSRISKVVKSSAANVLISLASRLGGEAGRDYVDYVARKHPLDSIRFQAVRTLAQAEPGHDARAFLERCGKDPSAYFREVAKQELERLDLDRN